MLTFIQLLSQGFMIILLMSIIVNILQENINKNNQ